MTLINLSFFGLILCLATFSSPLANAEPVAGSLELPELMAVAKNISESDTVVLIGIKNPLQGALDYSAVGFGANSDDLKNFAPKFLLTFGTDGFQRAYAFELGKDRQGMPKELIDGQKIRSQILGGNKGNLTLTAVSQFLQTTSEGLTLKILGPAVMDTAERARKDQGAKLLDIIQIKMASNEDIRLGLKQPPGDYPGLDQVLTPDRLTELNIALTARFNPQGLLSLGSGRADRPQLAEELRVTTRGKAIGRANRLTEAANRNNLKIARISERFAMLFLNCENIPKDEEWDAHRLNLKGSAQKIAKKADLGDLCSSDQKWAPLAIYGLERLQNAIQVIDFNDPNKLRNKALLERVRETALAALQVTVPVSAVPITVGEMLYTDERKRHGSTIFVNSRLSTAELVIEGETNHLSADLDGVITDSIKKNLEQISTNDDKTIKAMEAGLYSKNEAERSSALNQALSLIAQHQAGQRFLTGGDRRERSQLAKATDSGQALADHADMAFTRLGNQIEQHAAKAPKKTDNRPGTAPQAPAPAAPVQAAPEYACDPNQKSQVVFMIDGLRPDRLKRAVAQGFMPNISGSILNHSVQFNSFATTTISAPAWATMISGLREDQIGVIGSSSSSRDPADPDESWIDQRRNFKYYYVGAKATGSQVFQAIRENGGNIIPEGATRDRVYQSIFPAHDGVELPLKSLGKKAKDALLQLTYGSLNPTEILDAAAAEEARNHILENPCRFVSVRVYFLGIDDDSHANPYATESLEHNSYRLLDKAIGRVIEAAKGDPILKNGTFVLASDHGMAGGIEFADTDGTLQTGVTKPILISNTSFNPVRFYTGDYPGPSQDYGETVCSNMWPDEPMGGLISAPFRTVFRPYTFTYRGKDAGPKLEDSQKGCTVNVESYGSNRTDVLLRSEASAFVVKRDPTLRATYRELIASHTPIGKVVNRIEDALSFRLDNTTVDANSDARSLMEIRTGRHPVKFVAIGLQGDPARESADRLGGLTQSGPSQWDPTVLFARGPDGKRKTGLILAKLATDGTPRYRYIVVKSFDQEANGALAPVVEISKNPEDDPLEIKAVDGNGLDPAQWMREREILHLMENTPFPTGVVGPPLVFNRTGPAHSKKYLSRVPDYILYANEFFDFNTYQGQIADHGGISKVEAAATLVISNPTCNGLVQSKGLPVLSRQLADTLDELLTGRSGGAHHESLVNELAEACPPPAPK